MAWVKTGTVAVTNGSTTVTGTGTSWFGALQTGWGFVGPDQGIYEILTVDSATQITLATPYLGANASAQSYAAFPTNSLSADLTATLQALIANYQGVYDTVGQGRFLDGALAAPGMAFDADRDTGILRPGANILALVTGAVEQLRLTGGVASGAAVQNAPEDFTVGKLLKVGAGGLGAGECPELCVSGPAHAVSDTQASKRSPNIMANWFRAANHSRTFRPSFSNLRMAR